MDILYKQFGKRLKILRENKKLSQAFVANEVELSRTSITNIERGYQPVSLHLIYKLSEVLGVEPSDLLPNRSELVDKGVIAQRLNSAITSLPEGTGEWVQSFMSNDQNSGDDHEQRSDQEKG